MKIATLARGLGAAILLVPLASPPASAATANITAKVVQVLTSADATWGGCMARLSVNPQTLLAGCGAWFTTFSCSGVFTDAIRAYRMLDQAQLAFATGKNVYVTLDDTRKHNGYCFAKRIDVLN